MRFCQVRGWRGKALCPVWICCVRGLRGLGLVWCWGCQVVRIQWYPGGLRRVRVVLRGLASSRMGVVAVRIRFQVGGGQLLVVAARWMLQPSQVVVLPVHGLWAGGVGWRAVVVVMGLVLVVVLAVVVVCWGW